MTRDSLLFLSILLPVISSLLLLLIIRSRMKKPVFLLLEDVLKTKDWNLEHCEYFGGKLLAMVSNSSKLIFIHRKRVEIIDLKKLKHCTLSNKEEETVLLLTVVSGLIVSIPFFEKRYGAAVKSGLDRRALRWHNRINTLIYSSQEEEYEMGITE